MNDCTGRKIEIGDRIIYFGANSGNGYFLPGIVTNINKHSLGIISGGTHRDYINGEYITYCVANERRLKRIHSQLFVLDEFPDRPGWFNNVIKAMAEYAIENEDLDDKIRESCIYDLVS